MKVSNFSLDWLSFTYQNKGSLDLISDFWKAFPEFEKCKEEMFIVSGRHYSHGLCYDNDMTIMYDDLFDRKGNITSKGVNVEIPSHGLENVFKLLGVETVRDMFKLLDDRGCLPSRIDLCFDDFKKVYKPSYYYKKFISGSLVTRMRTVKMVHAGDGSGGETFYLGDRRKRMLRVYDKGIESGGEINSIRYEVEIHANASRAFFYHIIDSSESEVVAFGDLILDIMEVRRKSTSDKTVTRWEINKKWYNFIKSTFTQSSITIPPYQPDQLAENIEKNAEHNYSSFNFVVALHGLEATLRAMASVGINENHQAILRKKALDSGLHPDYYIKRCALLHCNSKNTRKGAVNY